MSIDYTAFDYIRIEPFTNVVNEIAKHRMQEDGKSSIYGNLHDLVYQLSMRHPEWQFVGEDSWYSHAARGFPVKRFRVYEDNDQIGHICVDTYAQDKFEIRNSRIDKTMAKRNHKSTKDVAKAVKIVEKFFGAKTLGEKVSEGRAKVASAIQNKAWTAGREFDDVMRKLMPAMTTYVVRNMAHMRPILESYGAPSAALDMLMEKNEARKRTKAASMTHSSNAGTTVLLHGDRYIFLRDSDPDNPVVLAASQLTDDVRGKLGVLKIVGDNEVIDSVGMRVNSTMFYLLP